MRPLDEMTAFDAIAILRRSIPPGESAGPGDRWRFRALAFLGRRASLRWARACLHRARVALENREGVEAIVWLQTAERWRTIAREYGPRMERLERKAIVSSWRRRWARAKAHPLRADLRADAEAAAAELLTLDRR